MKGFEIVPDLAEALPTVGDDGKSYTFKLRKGIKFSDGNEVTLNDVVASLQRIFKVSSPTSGGFYSVIVGADKCLAEPATCTLEGGVVVDEAAGTVTINLNQPDPELFQKLALPHAVILPADTPATDVGTQPIPGTGAYTIAAYDPNKQLKMVRNPHFKEWSVEAQPDGYPDEIDYDFGLTDEAAVTAIQNGEADWMFDPPPADRLVEIGTKYQDQVHIKTADRLVVRADEREHPALRQREGAAGGELTPSTARRWSTCSAGRFWHRRSARSCRRASPGTSPSASTPESGRDLVGA